MMLTDHIVVLLFAGLYPAYDFFYASKKFIKNAEAKIPGVRIRAYKSGIAGIWVLSLLALLSWIVNEREFVDFGLDFSLDWTLWSALGLVILALVYIIYLFKSLKGDTEQISALRARMDGPTTSLYLPRTKHEYRWFIFVSISAGICEELLYRGFLMWYIGQFSSIIVALILSSLLFGFAHAYQGWKGILQTGLLGLVFALIYFFTGSLWIPIALHIAIDIYSGMLGWLAFDDTFQMKHKPTSSEKIKKFLALTFLSLPLPIIKLMIGKAIEIDGQTMDPVVQFMVKFFVDHEVGYLPSVEEERREFDIQGSWFAHRPEPSVSITKRSVNGPIGEIPLEIHRPASLATKNAPALIFYHGGGHVSGSLESHRNICRQLAHDVNCAVVAVDFRLAPENKFPAGINDCLAAYDAVIQQAHELGFNPESISVGGDSAGGNAAAVVAQQRKSSSFPPKFQALWVPWLDMSKQTRSYELMGEGFFLEKTKMEWYTDHYLPSEDDGLNPLASPALGDVKGVCPAAIFSAGFDPLRDEGRNYAEKLEAAGVPVQYKLYEGFIHPFINVAGKIPVAHKAFNEAVDILKENM